MTQNIELTRPDVDQAEEPRRDRRAHTRTGNATLLVRGGRLLRRSWPLLAAFGITSILFVLHIAVYNPLSPVDEIQHIDYTLHLMHGDLVSSGDTFTRQTQDILACRWIDTAGPLGMPCGGPYDLGRMPGGGYDTAYIHAPFYYLTPAVTALAGQALGVPGDLVNLMRVSSLFWWALFVLAAWRFFAELGVNRWVSASGLVVLGTCPVVLQTYSSVNNDVTAMTAGAALALGALLWDRGALRLRWLVVLTAVAVAFKNTNVVAAVAVAVFMLARHWQRYGVPWKGPRSQLRRTWLAVVGLGAASVLVTVCWVVTVGHLAVMNPAQLPQNQSFHVTAFQPVWLVSSVDAFVPPIAPEFIDSALRSNWTTVLAALTDYGLMVLAVVGAVRAQVGSRTRALMLSAFAVALVAPSLFVLGQYEQSSIFVPVTSRYGLALVPMMLGVGLTALRGRTARICSVVVALLVAAVMAKVVLT